MLSCRVKVPPALKIEFLRLELRELSMSSSAEKNASDWFSLDMEVVLWTSFWMRSSELIRSPRE